MNIYIYNGSLCKGAVFFPYITPTTGVLITVLGTKLNCMPGLVLDGSAKQCADPTPILEKARSLGS